MTPQENGADGAQGRARIAELLIRYPELPSGDLDRIHHWFGKDATALDLGLLASDPTIAQQYRSYRADHHDRITPADLGRAAIFIGVALALIVVALMMR